MTKKELLIKLESVEDDAVIMVSVDGTLFEVLSTYERDYTPQSIYGEIPSAFCLTIDA